jgi:hypothetical protein
MPSNRKGSEMSHSKTHTKIKFTRTKGRVKKPAKDGNTPSSRSGTKQEAVLALLGLSPNTIMWSRICLRLPVVCIRQV